jgi:YQGE family putative transporter
MMLSGVSMIVMMSLQELNTAGIAGAGMIMGLSFGFYWANRDCLALSITNDSNGIIITEWNPFLYHHFVIILLPSVCLLIPDQRCTKAYCLFNYYRRGFF